jgi:bifunctional UDP-N-acetylglucosamine pyrophosphorylase/glucosamine-1-phosphate N-acetyltransferase
MFCASLEQVTTLRRQKALRELFQTDQLYLADGATLTLGGPIILGANVSFVGDSRLTGPVTIETGCVITNVQLGRDSLVRAYSILADLTAGNRNIFGPFCFIRDNCRAEDDCILGAHVEAARSEFASGVKISHRAFVGDARLGVGTIVGAGVVFCNFDGAARQATTVGDRVTLGSGSLIVPPLTIGEGATIAAGSVVTRSLPAGAKFIQKR